MENDFLLIDEPTNHLDMHARECVKEYLCGKKGFILVSHDRDILDACIDHVLVLKRKTIEVQSRVTQYERRMERKIQEKEGLLQDVEQPVSLKLMPLSYHKERLISCRELSVRYEGAESDTLKNLTFELMHGERVFLHGENGCGKSTLIKTILQQSGSRYEKLFVTDGEIRTASNLVVSYINQDTSFLQGDIRAFCRERNLEESLFFTLLRQLDMECVQFAKRLEEFSEGQKRRIKMLERIENVNEQVIKKMFLLYAESMADMEGEFKDRDEMEASYAAFLKEFIQNPKQMVFIETDEKQWVSGLRAVESEPGKWFLEAVETMPGKRNRGYGKKLIRHVTEFLKGTGAKKIDCIIGKSNLSSIKMHTDCGFKKTKEPPVNCWGELEEGRILFRLEI